MLANIDLLFVVLAPFIVFLLAIIEWSEFEWKMLR